MVLVVHCDYMHKLEIAKSLCTLSFPFPKSISPAFSLPAWEWIYGHIQKKIDRKLLFAIIVVVVVVMLFLAAGTQTPHKNIINTKSSVTLIHLLPLAHGISFYNSPNNNHRHTHPLSGVRGVCVCVVLHKAHDQQKFPVNHLTSRHIRLTELNLFSKSFFFFWTLRERQKDYTDGNLCIARLQTCGHHT